MLLLLLLLLLLVELLLRLRHPLLLEHLLLPGHVVLLLLLLLLLRGSPRLRWFPLLVVGKQKKQKGYLKGNRDSSPFFLAQFLFCREKALNLKGGRNAFSRPETREMCGGHLPRRTKKGTFPFFLHLVVYCRAAADPPPPGSRVGILVAGVKVRVGGRQVAHAAAEVAKILKKKMQ